MAYKSVTVTPSIAAEQFVQGDVLFNPTELKLPNRGAKLTSLFVVDTENQLNNETLSIYFFQKNTNNLGTANATADISIANFRANQFIGVVVMSGSSPGNQLDNLNVRFTDRYYDEDDPSPTGGLELPLNSIESGNAIYFSAVISVASTTPNFTAADSVDFVFGFEY